MHANDLVAILNCVTAFIIKKHMEEIINDKAKSLIKSLCNKGYKM